MIVVFEKWLLKGVKCAKVFFFPAATVDDLFGDADDISSDEEANKKRSDDDDEDNVRRGFDDDEENKERVCLTFKGLFMVCVDSNENG